jgi:hypothetical protein
MIRNRLNLNTPRNLRLTGIVPLVAALLGAAAYLSAYQPETPIVVGDGSLTMTSSMPWSSFTGTGSSKVHPHNSKAVASVTVSGPSFSGTPIPFNGQMAEIVITYAGSFKIDILTGNNGTNLTVATDFSSFHGGVDGNHLAHNNATGSITHVTVLRGGQPVTGFDQNASPHTQVTVQFNQ